VTDAEAAFARLSPALRYQIVNGLGFAALRPVQAMTIGPVLDGEHVVVLAPTAGGKTEAAFFPLLSRMDSEDHAPLSLLYVSPIRALLNNQRDRLEHLAGLLGRRVFTWHGDVPQGERRRFLKEPTDILLTTPESLEVMLMSPRVPARRLFAGLRAVVIDEVHAFVRDDRGGHLAAVLERLTRLCGRDLQRVALSATVGNPDDILAWLRGSSQRPGRVLRAPGASVQPELVLDYVASEANAAKAVAKLFVGDKRLVFVESRRAAEQMANTLHAQGVAVFVSHSSLSVDARAQAERAFAEARDCVIVATSALELGIDVGDLDRVLQLDAPGTVASFLQRMGRTGRRPGARTNCTFLCTEPTRLVQAAALLRLHRQGYIEPVRAPQRAAHLLAHQLLAMAIEHGGVPESDAWAWVAGAAPFAGLTVDDYRALIAHMLAQGILHRDGGRLSLGEDGEKRYGRKNFEALYAVFDAPRVLTVMWAGQEVGQVDAQFLSMQQEEGDGVVPEARPKGPMAFVLGGKAWRVTSVEWGRAVVHVRPAEDARIARWMGQPVVRSRVLCEAIREVLTSEDVDPWWSSRAREAIAAQRAEHEFLPREGSCLIDAPGALRWWTFAGGAANHLIARTLDGMLGASVTADDLGVTLREGAGSSEAGVRQALASLAARGGPDLHDARAVVGRMSGAGRVSKFQPCLTPEMLGDLLVERLFDIDAALAVVAGR
jgi:ATP-dependent Lhr-like helicase